MNSEINNYYDAFDENDKVICSYLLQMISTSLPQFESKIWHGHPVWFDNGNPIVGFSKLKGCIRLLFWSGQSFDESELQNEGKFKAAEKRFASLHEMNSNDIERWCSKAREIQWDYKNIVKRKGVLLPLKGIQQKKIMNEQIHISAEIAAPKNQVWTKYTDPLHIVNWNFASPDWCCPAAKNDLRVDGLYDVRMEAKDGSFGFDFRATYTELEADNSFTYRMEDGRMCKVDFTETEGGTKMDIHFDPENMNPVELQQAGWQAILNNFKAYVESI